MSKSDILKTILKYYNKIQKVSKRDTSDIGSKNSHTYYRKLPKESESNRKKTVKPYVFLVILDPAEFSCGSFQNLNHSKHYGPEIENISIRPSKSREIIYIQKFVIVGWRVWVWISSGIFLPFVTKYPLDNYK